MNVLKIKPAKKLQGCIKVPGDKSISHRAAILSSLAEGTSRIDNFLTAGDCLSTVNCLQSLGVKIDSPKSGTLMVHGVGIDGLREPEDILDAGNSGTTMRLLIGLLSSMPFFSVITGDSSLRKRPMGRVVKPLSEMGAKIAGRNNDTLAPLALTGTRLKPISYDMPVASAQVKSAILLAGLRAQGVTTITEPALSRDHTERMLEYMGAPITRCGHRVSLQGPCNLKSLDHFIVPGDISSASFFIVAATIVPGSDIIIVGVGINPTRTGIIDVMCKMGADIDIYNRREDCGEPVADIRVRYAPIKGITIGKETIPSLIDEIPVLAVAASVARGETFITGAGELKYKETNRISAVVEELTGMGVKIKELPDGMVISGNSKIRGCSCHSHGDHRIAMAISIAGLLAEGETIIKEPDCLEISFPQFPEVLNFLTEDNTAVK